MFKILIGVLVLAGLGVGVWLGAPLFYDTRVNEAVPEGAVPFDAVSEESDVARSLSPTASPESVGVNSDVVAERPAGLTGTFQGADSFHQAGGTARVLSAGETTYIRFEDDFSVTNGPDLFVYLGKDGAYDPATNLGRLKGSVGAQNYEVPASLNLDEYDEVWVWCRAFAVPFGAAQLR